MTPAEKAKWIVNEQYYQPLTLHLNVNNNSKQMWDYAKRCANIAVDELIESKFSHRWFEGQDFAEIADEFTQDYWIKVKSEIEKL